MLTTFRFALSALMLGLVCARTAAQDPPPTGKPQSPPPPPPTVAGGEAPTPKPPPADAVAATVNGHKIPELAIYRATLRAHPSKRAELRGEVLNFLIDNTLIDQYLEGLKVAVDPKDVDARFTQIQGEITKAGQQLKDVLEKMCITEAELRTQIFNTLRWDSFLNQYGTDKALQEFFDANKTMFDGSQVKARHILIKSPVGDAKAAEAARTRALALRKQIEEAVAAGMKTIADKDKLEQETRRLKLLEDTFAAVAAKESDCPSKAAGGELGWFPRAGRMVEPFAKAAFALKPHQLSEPVMTDFGAHLILPTDTRPGREVKFADLKEVVKEVYGDRMRDAVLARMRPQARIEITPAPKQN